MSDGHWRAWARHNEEEFGKALNDEQRKLRAIAAIAEWGTHQIAASAAGVEVSTLRSWRKADAVFDRRIKEAISAFKNNLPKEIEEYSNQALRDAFAVGRVTRTSKKATRITKSADGEVTGTVETEETTETNHGIPDWAIEIAFPDIDRAVALLKAAGYQVIDPTTSQPPNRKRAGARDENFSRFIKEFLRPPQE